jgi:hypothetical protein
MSRRGRPPKPPSERNATASASLPGDVFAAICRRAKETRTSVSAVIAAALTPIFRNKENRNGGNVS